MVNKSKRCYFPKIKKMSDKPLTLEEKDRIEKNRREAQERLSKKRKFNDIPVIETVKNNVISIDGNKFIDSKGGFLIEDTPAKPEPKTDDDDHFELLDLEFRPCKECGKEFIESYLQKNFNYMVCDACRDNEEKHSLITRSDLKKEYLLKDCDIDLREPPLKYICRKNPHNVRWGDMKLYLLPQVTERAIEVWGSLEQLEKEHDQRDDKRTEQKAKKYNKNLKALRMSARSSLFNRTKGANHEHEFGPETYNEDDDTFTKCCKTCPFVDTYEKM